MVAPLFDISPLLPAIASNTLILTPNSRLRNKILEAYGRLQAAAGTTVLTKPRVESIAAWLAEQWQCLLDAGCESARGCVITTVQAELLWQQVLAEAPLLNIEQMAGLADLAYRNLALWQLPLASLDSFNDPDTHQFLQWAKAFEQCLAQRQLIYREHSYAIIGAAYNEQLLAPEPVIHLQGFDDLPPLFEMVVSAACHTLTRGAAARHPAPRLRRTEAETAGEELHCAAQWALQVLRHEPAATIGIIVPNLGQCRQQVETCFTKVFEARALLPETARYTLPFNFSAGVPLATTAPVAGALQLLNLNRNRIDLEPLCALLLSPFLGATEAELAERTALAARLRQLAKPRVSGADLRYCSEAVGAVLAGQLQQFEQLRRRATARQSPSAWLALFAAQLAALDWPGQRRLDSNEYQQVTQWYQVLEAFAGLDVAGVPLDLAGALKALQHLALTTHFQAQVPDSPVQILGALEGAGLNFTHCWVTGLQQNAWPPAPAPHPLLPIDLQRQQRMPHADSARELAFAQALTDGYRACAGQVIFSACRRDGDSEQAPSQLIADIALTPMDDVVVAEPTALEQFQTGLRLTRQLQWVDSARGPAFDPRRETLRGGSGILQHQAACPFDAFAIHRLGAQAPVPPGLGFSAIEKGMILHEALAAIWRQLHSQGELLALAPTALTERVDGILDDIIAGWARRRPDYLGKRYCELEKQRQSRLVLAWLAFEKKRPPFSVLAVEERLETTVAGLPLVLRLDRLDQFDDGRRLLIDYKAGKPAVQRWQGPRPQEPQLPLYAISLEAQIDAIAFAEINAGEQRLHGVGDLGGEHAGIRALDTANLDLPDNWPAAMAHWREVLETLAQEFLRGDAGVIYSDKVVQRYYTDFVGLNRILEQPQLARVRAAEKWPLAAPAS
ncbi:hypothetical protein FKG94_09290 [Exilibacterium tricleocarpae]|uniref:PD-(D/E)XK endonuclease-like domain-containing protein n=1 Tax=Exilibacterium tricleocarpae TaxID=2591008 RepID=A0A545TVM9_9GAMM|nr:hypothetical protein [Exilibacterium tricleocarpae]TQV81279.1 hypothetical protein FKG94_09290 [Exilibacterium tricleocarpae]